MARLKTGVVAATLCGVILFTRPATAYSVLAHEANVDALWDGAIKPLLLRRFPRSDASQLDEARAYAYGGSVIQDLGYYPFGSHFFSNLLHYVRTGEFVETMIRDAQGVEEYAFALGALAHYAGDNAGHPAAVNRAVPVMFPKLRAKYGNAVTYMQSPASHILVEFSFDVVQAAGGAYAPDAFHSFIGFKVAKPLLERAFHETYGIEMKDVFFNEDLAISTYRHAISQTIPQITKIAWRAKQEEIARLMPGIAREKFVFTLTRRQYEQEFGADYRKPGLFARFLGVLYRLLPKVGPLRPLSFKAPTPQTEALFLESLKETREQYRNDLAALSAGRLNLANTDFDTGKQSAHGEYELADETYAGLLDRLAGRKFADVPDALRNNINRYYGAPGTVAGVSRKERQRADKIKQQLAALNAA
jgi:Zinc dependent phospholipase C